MLKVVSWDHDYAITHDFLRMRGDVIILLPQGPLITFLTQ
jgi:hypothetical protein